MRAIVDIFSAHAAGALVKLDERKTDHGRQIVFAYRTVTDSVEFAICNPPAAFEFNPGKHSFTLFNASDFVGLGTALLETAKAAREAGLLPPVKAGER
jgi:hypothetical protein